ncbi:antibiotic biosynthesis monooxygenase family protein [Streptomyces specialis]|uniref:antibiotic biosynthesis monooxygenase family protein n=1 Tax=Streptomyces specialis TaxID=498367 RepID=UPI00073EE213|nr:antibiotic biosynthesis monooxygenase family protein [Streptomyces specialis]
MPEVRHLDPATPMPAQLQEKTGPVVLVNTFFVPREAMDEFLTLWGADAAVMKAQPGFISTQMHRGTAGSQLLVNIAVWESTEALARAHANPEFRKATAKLPDGVIAHPHVFEKIAVEGVCVA